MLLDTNLVTAFLHRDALERTPNLAAFVGALLQADGLAISFVTQFELRRGIEQLVGRGEGRRKLVAFEKFVERVQVFGLDAASGEGWNLAARLWSEGRNLKPARLFSDGDLLVAATAALHSQELATADVGLAEGLRLLPAFPRRRAPRPFRVKGRACASSISRRQGALSLEIAISFLLTT